MRKLLVDQTEFHHRARAGRGDGTGVGVFRPEARVLRTVDETKRIVRWVFSDGSVDRVGDTINPTGWVLTGYKANPVVLFAHDSLSPPVGRTVSVWSDGTRLLGDVEFADAATYDFGDTIFKLVKGGFIKAGSVGFMPLKWSYVDDKNRPYGIDFEKQELLEFSIVPVPANASALVEARAKGIDTTPFLRWTQRTQSHDPGRATRSQLVARAMRRARALEAVVDSADYLARIRIAAAVRAEARRVLKGKP